MSLKYFFVAVAMLGVASAHDTTCNDTLASSKLSPNYAETIAHATHSMTVEGLRLFNPSATDVNSIATVALSVPGKVLPNAPEATRGEGDFVTDTMDIIDGILASLGGKDDALGPNWSPLERVVHAFHMRDLWRKVHETYTARLAGPDGDLPSPAVCKCLLDPSVSDAPGAIREKVRWVADHYEVGTPITLLNRPIPKLTDAVSWVEVWKPRLLHYYSPEALLDAAVYLHCATMEN